MKDVNEYKTEFERIINQTETTKQEIKHQLFRLLIEMAQCFNIPLHPNEEFKEKNKELMKVFNEIAEVIRNTKQ